MDDKDYQAFVERMTSFPMDFNTQTNQNELKHYGVIGMKWGVRRGPNRVMFTRSRQLV